MRMDRREFVALLPALAAACSSVPARKPLRVLVLGGTNFVGPHLVQTALDRGHTVTMFNRGKTRPDLFPGVERLIGDRFPDRAPGLRALEGSRQWDVVFDTWSSAPGVVGASADLLRDRAGVYAYVSSIAVYGSFKKIGLVESDPTVTIGPDVDLMDPDMPYPFAKRRAEQFLENLFPSGHVIGRATSINGFDLSGDPRNQQSYWPLRIRRGGEVLAPGNGNDPFQYIDVKDYARFMMDAGERSLFGVFNVVGPAQPIAFQSYLSVVNVAAGGDARLTAVTTSFLLEKGIRPFEDLPSWIPANDPEPGFFQISNARAVEHGLTFRPLAETVRDVLRSVPDQAPHVAGGLPPEKEREILGAWHAHSA